MRAGIENTQHNSLILPEAYTHTLCSGSDKTGTIIGKYFQMSGGGVLTLDSLYGLSTFLFPFLNV